LAIFLLFSLVELVGCSDAPKAAQGRVTLDKVPLSEAMILFVPLETGRKKTGAEVQGGVYQVAEQNGLFHGRYRVEVHDNPPMELAHRTPQEVAAAMKSRRKIPRAYAHESPLIIDVVPDGDITDHEFNFDLSSMK
jgi:hypothetical protein